MAWATLLAPFLVLTTKQIKEWEQSGSAWARLYPDGVCLFTLLLVTGLMTRFLDRRAFSTMGLTPARAGRDLVLGLVLGAAWLLFPLLIAWLAGWVEPQRIGTVSLIGLAGAAVATFFNVVTQQLLLCGYIWQTIQLRWGLWAAMIASTVLFSAYHAGAFHGAWLPAVNVLAAGAVFGLCYRLSGSLWLPIGCHFAWNFLLGQVFGLTVSGNRYFNSDWKLFSLSPNLYTGGQFGFEGGLLVSGATILFAAALAWWIRRRSR